MTIVVTGAQGQLGSEVCRQLGAEAVALDLPEFDLAKPEAVRRTLLTLRPRAIINTAAYTLVDRAEQEPGLCRRVNVEGVACLVEVCRQLDSVLIQISTDYVFGRDARRRTPYRETDHPGPMGVYATSKVDGERHVASWPKHFIVRTCGLYGNPSPRSSGNFVATMVRLAGQRRAIRVVDDQCCSPTYVPHLAGAIRFLLGVETYGTYHVVNGGETTWYGFAVEIFRQMGIEARVQPITSAEFGAAAPRPAYSVLDTAKYLALSGRPDLPSWREALAEHLARQQRPPGALRSE